MCFRPIRREYLGWQYCKAGERLTFLSAAINFPLLRGDRMSHYRIKQQKKKWIGGMISEVMNVNDTGSEDILKQTYQRVKGKKKWVSCSKTRSTASL